MSLTRKLLIAASACVLAGCDIGDGSAPQTLEIRIDGVTEDAEVFACASQVPQAVLTFTDGQAADFVRRVEWSSSDTDILEVSDGTLEAPQGFFVTGALLPKRAGTVTLRADYLDFSDEIDVTVTPTQLEVGPARSRVLVGRNAQLVDTLVIKGRERFFSQDFNQVGTYSIDGVDTESEEPAVVIDPVLGTTTVNQAGEYTARYSVDFCGQEATGTIVALDEELQQLQVVDRATEEPLTDLELLLDQSKDVSVLGTLESGTQIDLTGAVGYRFVDDNGDAVADVAFASVRGVGTISAFARPDTPDGETPPSFPRQVNLEVFFDPTPFNLDESEEGDETFAPRVSVRVLESELVAESLRVLPTSPTILPGSGLSFSASADFSGPGGDFSNVDVTKDVQWVSSSTARATINNTVGSKGFAFAPLQRLAEIDGSVENITNLGDIDITARRFSGEGVDADTPPEATTDLSIGRPDAEDGEETLDAVTLRALNLVLRDSDAELTQNQSVFVQALGELVRGDQLIDTQDLSAQVVWELEQPSDFARISNGSGRKGLVTVLTDQTVTVTVRARYFTAEVQGSVIAASLELELNPQAEQGGQ
nr:hypothetical protein [Oceanococcus sp. HetDA_MAG_MS8]